MEIERKWLTEGWPQGTPQRILKMEQGYIAVAPAVRIRSHEEAGKPTQYILCFKGQGGFVAKRLKPKFPLSSLSNCGILLENPLFKKSKDNMLCQMD